jgi:hypothetical protein
VGCDGYIQQLQLPLSQEQLPWQLHGPILVDGDCWFGLVWWVLVLLLKSSCLSFVWRTVALGIQQSYIDIDAAFPPLLRHPVIRPTGRTKLSTRNLQTSSAGSQKSGVAPQVSFRPRGSTSKTTRPPIVTDRSTPRTNGRPPFDYFRNALLLPMRWTDTTDSGCGLAVSKFRGRLPVPACSAGFARPWPKRTS